MISNVLASDPMTGISQIFHYDEAEDKYILETIQDCDDIVQHNKDFFNNVDERARWKGDMNRVASIPLSVYFELRKKGLFKGSHLSKGDRKWLNDADNRFFRTRPGRV